MEKFSPESARVPEEPQERRLLKRINVPILEVPKEHWKTKQEVLVEDVEMGGVAGDLQIELFRQVTVEGVDEAQYPFGLKMSFNTKEGEAIAYYNATLKTERGKIFWVIVTRKVEQQFRHRGIGSTTLALMEELMNRVSTLHDMKAEWMEMNTMLGSLASLAEKRGWRPKPGEEEQFEHLKKLGHEDAGEVKEGVTPVNIFKSM